jgi:SulP family sulfate permease
MIGQGAANVASGMLGGYSVEGSLSKTTVADNAGQKTQLASLITAGLILLTVLVLAGVFTNLPDAVLGAVVIDAGISLIKFEEFRYYRKSTRDFAAFVATALVVFFVGVLAGVIAGVGIALLLLIVSSSKTPTRRLGFDKEDNTYVHADNHPEAELPSGILVVGIYGPLFFADAENFRYAVLDLVKSDDFHTVVVDFGAVATMDMDGVRALSQLASALRDKGVNVRLVSVGKEHIELMRSSGALDEHDVDKIHRTVRSAVAAAQTDHAPHESSPAS